MSQSHLDVRVLLLVVQDEVQVLLPHGFAALVLVLYRFLCVCVYVCVHVCVCVRACV